MPWYSSYSFSKQHRQLCSHHVVLGLWVYLSKTVCLNIESMKINYKQFHVTFCCFKNLPILSALNLDINYSQMVFLYYKRQCIIFYWTQVTVLFYLRSSDLPVPLNTPQTLVEEPDNISKTALDFHSEILRFLKKKNVEMYFQTSIF